MIDAFRLTVTRLDLNRGMEKRRKQIIRMIGMEQVQKLTNK